MSDFEKVILNSTNNVIFTELFLPANLRQTADG